MIVDELFADYLSRPNVKQPILTQYCDGRQVQCPNWMTQWGSKSLGDQGYSPIANPTTIIMVMDMYINTAEAISGHFPFLLGLVLYSEDWAHPGNKVRADAGAVKMCCRCLSGYSKDHC